MKHPTASGSASDQKRSREHHPPQSGKSSVFPLLHVLMLGCFIPEREHIMCDNKKGNCDSSTDDDIPIPLPHYKVQNGKFLFMEFREKKLDTLLIEGFSKITGQCSIGTLRKKFQVPIETIMELEKKSIIVIKKK